MFRAPEVSSLPALIMNFSSGLVWAGHSLGLGSGEVAGACHRGPPPGAVEILWETVAEEAREPTHWIPALTA